MDLSVRIDKTLPAFTPDAVLFETGLSREDLKKDFCAYEHHGQDFTTTDRGALVMFYEDLLLGRPMPPTFATHSIQDIDTLMAVTLFLHRDLATHPATPAFVYTVDFVHRLGLPALAHIDEDLARFLSALRTYFPDKGLSQRELGERLRTAIGWIKDYLQNDTIQVGTAPRTDVRVLDHGTVGFVVAETSGSLWDGWVELFRVGFLRGVLVKTAGDRKEVLASRKSEFIAFDLRTAAHLLNQMEIAMGELPGWSVTDEMWLKSPEDGTLILLQDITQILVRV